MHHLQSALTTVRDEDLLAWVTVSTSALVHGIDHFLTLDHLSEHDVLAVEPGALDEGDEELGAVGVGTSVGHR